jgi:hypothetical protein
MIDLTKIDGGQVFDEKSNCVFPWFTKSFLDELSTWDLSDKNIFIYGIGADVKWFQRKAKIVCGVDEKFEWVNSVREDLVSEGKYTNVNLRFTPTMDGFTSAIYDFDMMFDIVVIDGDYWRDQCVIPAINRLKNAGVLIIDNYDQPSVWQPNKKTREVLKDFECKFYKQAGHTDWQTATFTKK